MTWDTWAVWTFWIAAVGVFYPYAGYPLLLLLARRLVSTNAPVGAPELPTISMIVPVHNEASRLERKIGNTLALDYPADRIEIILVSDGSTDDTVALIKAKGNPRLTLLELPERRGKAAALNAGVARATGAIVVFTDASIALATDALRAIVQTIRGPARGLRLGRRSDCRHRR